MGTPVPAPITDGGEGTAGRGAARWAGKGLTAVLDEGVFFGCHFMVNVLLARWLPLREYGAFALAYSIFVLARP